MKNLNLKKLKRLVGDILIAERLPDTAILELDCIEEMNHAKIIRKCGVVSRCIDELESELEFLYDYCEKRLDIDDLINEIKEN